MLSLEHNIHLIESLMVYKNIYFKNISTVPYTMVSNTHHLVIDLVEVNLAHFIDHILIFERDEAESCGQTRDRQTEGRVSSLLPDRPF